MTQYYYLTSRFPKLKIGQSPEINFRELVYLLEDNLTASDLKKTQVVRRFYDIKNLKAIWMGAPLEDYGNYNEQELEEALLTSSGLPEYVYQFCSTYESDQKRYAYFPKLQEAYFQEEIKKACHEKESFLCQYLTFERNWRLVFTGFRAKKLGKSLVRELQFQDPYDDLVAQILAQKDAKDYEPPADYEALKPIFKEYKNDPMGLHKALCEYRFQYIEELISNDMFSFDRVLGFMVQLIIVEKWMAMDKEEGNQIVDQLVKEEV